jgi:imidazolonepropionase
MGVGEFSGRSPLGDASAFAAACQYVRNTPAATLEFAAGRYIEACLRHGTTTIEIKTGYGLNAAGELKMLRVLAGLNDRCVSVVPTFLGAHAVPPEYFGRNQEYLAWLCTELLPRLQERRVAQFVDVLCDPEGFSLDETRVYLDAARRLGLAVKVHAEQNSHTGAARLAVESDAASVDGLNHADDTDADLLARSRAVAVLLPGSVHQGSYSRFPPARMLIRAGVAVALASGFQPAVCSAFNIQMILSLACTHLGMTPEEAISAATINGAHALGRAQRCGSLQFGKDADLIIMNVSDYREIPFYYGCNLAAAVMRRGEIVYREGAVTCGAAP